MIHLVTCEHYSKYLKLWQAFSHKHMPVFRAAFSSRQHGSNEFVNFSTGAVKSSLGKSVCQTLVFGDVTILFHGIPQTLYYWRWWWFYTNMGIFFLFSIINSLTRTFHAEISFLSRDSTIKHSAGCDIVVFVALVRSWVSIKNLLEEKNFYK